MPAYYIVSGGFDPIHEGHIAMIQAAAKKSDGVILLLNSDEWLRRKKGKNFMSFDTRYAICSMLKYVIDVLAFDDSDNSASDGIRKIRAKYPDARLVFANGGDRTKENIPETAAANECNVELEFGVGGAHKANSSSWILKEWNKQPNKKSSANQPLITIITTTFNLIKAGRKDTFLQMVESIRNQDYPNIEHIVIDGASADGTVDLLKQTGVTFISEPDKGIHDACNKGIARAKGKYIAFLNSDDYYESKEVVSKTVKALEESGADFSYADMHILDRQTGQRTIRKSAWRACFVRYPINTPTVFMSKKMLEELHGFDPIYKASGDYDLITRALLKGYRSVEVPLTGIVFRSGGMSESDPVMIKEERIHILKTDCGLDSKQALRAHEFQFMPHRILKKLLAQTKDFPAKRAIVKRNFLNMINFVFLQIFTLRLKPGKRCFRLCGITFVKERV